MTHAEIERLLERITRRLDGMNATTLERRTRDKLTTIARKQTRKNYKQNGGRF